MFCKLEIVVGSNFFWTRTRTRSIKLFRTRTRTRTRTFYSFKNLFILSKFFSNLKLSVGLKIQDALIRFRVVTGPEFSNRSGPAGSNFRPVRSGRFTKLFRPVKTGTKPAGSKHVFRPVKTGWLVISFLIGPRKELQKPMSFLFFVHIFRNI